MERRGSVSMQLEFCTTSTNHRNGSPAKQRIRQYVFAYWFVKGFGLSKKWSSIRVIKVRASSPSWENFSILGEVIWDLPAA